MELTLLENFARSAETSTLLGDVEELARKVNEFRPMSSEVVEAVRKKLFPERVYSSNAIEGNTLSLRETTEVLATGHISDRRRREGTEAVNLGAAVRQLEDAILPDADPYTEEKFLHLHKTLMSGLGVRSGHYRTDRRMIAGAKHQPPRPELLPELMSRIFSELKTGGLIAQSYSAAVWLASWGHWAIARVHPFEDGNGRMARLWQDLILLRAQLAPAIIRLQDRDQNGYYDALAGADDGDLNSLAQLIAQRTAATLNEYIAAQQQVHLLADWAAKIAGETSIRTKERRRARYLQWSNRMEAMRNDFQRCVARITSSGIEVQMFPYPLIDETVWENIRSGVGAKHTWFFKLAFRKDAQRYTYIFFFGKHYWNDEANYDDRGEPRVALLISEQIDRGDATILKHQPDNPVELREIFATENSLVAVKMPINGEVQYIRDVDPMRVAMEFIEQVLLRRIS